MKFVKNKIVLITGSSVGIGREAAYCFAKEGACLIITYCKGRKEAEETAQRCRKLGSPKVICLQLNVKDKESIKDAIVCAVDEFGGIDILVNNAGVIRWKTLNNQNDSDIEEQITVNITGLIKTTKAALPYIRDLIINISSGSGKRGHSELTTYCATKFAVRGFTKALAAEINLKALSVNPPLTSTRMSNYQGLPAEQVGERILAAAKDADSIESGSDIDIEKI